MCQLCFIYMVEDPRISISYYLKLQHIWGVAFLCPVFTLFKAFHRRLFFPVVGRHQPGVISTFAGGDKMWRQQSRPSITSPTHLPLPASTLIFHSSTPGLQSLSLSTLHSLWGWKLLGTCDEMICDSSLFGSSVNNLHFVASRGEENHTFTFPLRI